MSAAVRSLLVVKTSNRIDQEVGERIRKAVQPTADLLGAELLVTGPDMEVALMIDLAPLVAALNTQAEAISRLAASNEMLIQVMAESEGVDEDRVPVVGLNGRAL